MTDKKEFIYTTSNIKNMLACSNYKSDPSGSPAMERGSIIHSILEEGIENYDKTGSTYRGKWRPYKYLEELDLSELEDIATQFIDDHKQWFTGDWKVEQELHTKTRNKGYAISGIVDKMIINATEAVLLDWKTGVSRASTKSDFDMLQAVMYAYLAFQNYPYITNATFTYVYIDSIDDHVSLRFHISDLPKMEAFIERMIYATHYTGLKINEKCKWCVNKATCPLMAQKSANLETLSAKELKNVKNAIDVILKELRGKQLEEELNNNELKTFTNVKMYYINPEELPDIERLALLKDKVKITKKKALYYKQLGYKVMEKDTYRQKR